MKIGFNSQSIWYLIIKKGYFQVPHPPHFPLTLKHMLNKTSRNTSECFLTSLSKGIFSLIQSKLEEVPSLARASNIAWILVSRERSQLSLFCFTAAIFDSSVLESLWHMQISFHINIPAVLSLNDSDFSGEKQMKGNVLQCWAGYRRCKLKLLGCLLRSRGLNLEHVRDRAAKSLSKWVLCDIHKADYTWVITSDTISMTLYVNTCLFQI